MDTLGNKRTHGMLVELLFFLIVQQLEKLGQQLNQLMLGEIKFRSSSTVASIQKSPATPFEDSPKQRRKTDPTRIAAFSPLLGELSEKLTPSNNIKSHAIRR